MSSKLSKSSPVSEHSNKATPKVVNRLTRVTPKTDSPADPSSPLKNPRLSIERSQRSRLNLKPNHIDRRSPKLSTPPEKQQTRAPRVLELQAQLSLVQDDLKNAKEKIILIEKEKPQADKELKDAQKSADKANGKLMGAQVAQKRTGEIYAIERLRVDLEQAAIKSTQKNKEEWEKELEAVQNQHAQDVAALLLATEELQRVKQELTEKESLSAEVAQLKAILDSKLDNEADGNTRQVSELDLEREVMEKEFEISKRHEQMLVETEARVEQLNVELEVTKLAESYARKSIEEWKIKVQDLEARAKESDRVERSASESMESMMKQLEGNNYLLIDSETEVASLREKVGLLEIYITRQRGDLQESERQLSIAKKKASEMTKKAESLENELQNVEDEKVQALNDEKLAADSVQTLLEEKNKLTNELENLRVERLSSSQMEQGNYEDQIEHLRLVLNATNDKYKSILDEAKHEIDILTDTIEQNKEEYQKLRTEWEQKEVDMNNHTKKLEDENSLLQTEMSKVTKLLREAEEEAGAMKELKISLKRAKVEDVFSKDIIRETKAESMRFKGSFLDKENELHSVIEENDTLRTKEATLIEEIKKLKIFLDEAMSQKKEMVNCELSDNDKECDVSTKIIECYEQNGHGGEEEKPNIELLTREHEQFVEENLELDSGNYSDKNVNADEVEAEVEIKDMDMDGNQKYYVTEKKEEETNRVDAKKWEILENGENELPHDKEERQEGQKLDIDSNVYGFNQEIGLNSTEMVDNGRNSSLKQHQKQKKPLLHKFGSLLKRKGTINQK